MHRLVADLLPGGDQRPEAVLHELGIGLGRLVDSTRRRDARTARRRPSSSRTCSSVPHSTGGWKPSGGGGEIAPMRRNISPSLPSGVQHAIAIRPSGRQTRRISSRGALVVGREHVPEASRSPGRSCRPRTAGPGRRPRSSPPRPSSRRPCSRAISSRPGEKSSPVTRAASFAAGIGGVAGAAGHVEHVHARLDAGRLHHDLAGRGDLVGDGLVVACAPHVVHAGYPYHTASDLPATLRRMDPIVTATDLHRRYGEGDAAVDALAGVTRRLRARPLHRDHGPVGLRQVDAHAHPRRARPAHRRARSCSTASRSRTSTTAT